MKSSETWRIEAWKSFAISKSGMQGGEAKRNLPWSILEDNHRQSLLEHFPKSIFYILYTISKLRKSRIQCFKRYAIWSWNEGVTAIASRLLQAERQNVARLRNQPWAAKMLSFCCENFAAMLHSATEFLLKLPDIYDRHFEIFCFRYLMFKSPNSPCNPPIIGFLSL